MGISGSGVAEPGASPLLPGFEYAQIDVHGVTVNHAIAGSGPPLLLLHGYPENHLMWRHVAPALVADHTVVVADLRGYGDSGKPAPDAAGLVYSKRSMARDQAGLMRQLGFAQFGLCPVLALWGTQAFVGRNYEPVSVWEEYASDVRGTALPTGHFLPEEAPDVVSSALHDFFS